MYISAKFAVLIWLSCGQCLRVKRGSGPRTITFSDSDVQEIVTKHNKLRASVTSSDMRFMTWDLELSVISQNYGKKCQFSHNTQGQHSFFKNSIGENIYVSSGSASNFDPSRAIQLWFDEKSDFTYSTRKCEEGKKCGHYTQVVWASTYKVGCSLTMCDDVSGFRKNSHLFICNYSPAGNIYSRQDDGSHAMMFPFLKGAPCSECQSTSDFCKENLCANEVRDKDTPHSATSDQASGSSSCDGLIVAVVLLSLVVLALLCYIIYQKRVALSLKYEGWGGRTSSNHAKFSNQNTPQPSRSNTPRPSIVAATLHGTSKVNHENKKSLLASSKVNDSEKAKKQVKNVRLVFETASSQHSSSPSKPTRPPLPT